MGLRFPRESGHEDQQIVYNATLGGTNEEPYGHTGIRAHSKRGNIPPMTREADCEGGTLDPLISPKELHAQLSGQNPPTVIDVRGEEAFRAGHIPGARHVPADDIGRSLARIPRDRPIVTY